jgi:hypothetical protein
LRGGSFWCISSVAIVVRNLHSSCRAQALTEAASQRGGSPRPDGGGGGGGGGGGDGGGRGTLLIPLVPRPAQLPHRSRLLPEHAEQTRDVGRWPTIAATVPVP